jgi:hypothetical protein
MGRNKWIIAAIFLIAIAVACGYYVGVGGIRLVDAKIATGVDENLIPLEVKDVFPKGTSKVSCWIKWRNAKINTQLVASWHYVTDDIHILDYSFIIPKKEGMGNMMLSMPDGTNLPSGRYKVNLILGKRILKSLGFKIE